MRARLARTVPEGNRTAAPFVLFFVALVGPERVRQTPDTVAYLRSPRAIRERSAQLYARALRGDSSCFRVRPERLGAVAAYVAEVVRDRYPRLDAPLNGRLRHFDAGGRARTRELDERLASFDPIERARTKIDLVVPSVLLDAGAGATWAFTEDGVRYGRSEGLALASLDLFLSGALSSSGKELRCDAAGLRRVTAASLGRAFQVGTGNEIVGLEGRAAVLSALGRALEARADIFGFGSGGRPGALVDWAMARAKDGKVEAAALLGAVLDGLCGIWPGRVELAGFDLGDAWPHPALGEGATGLVPFHKLPQWMTCSLIEPLGEAGVEVVGVDALSPLAEYRNGGLLLDLGVLELADDRDARSAHEIGSPLVVEWRALTVCLIDEVSPRIADALAISASSLQGQNLVSWATWAAGRKLAAERRPGGAPPLPLVSDGTVF